VLPKLLKQEQTVYQNYVKSLKDEESMWRLKSRCMLLHAGDKNTSFFHNQAKARQWRNRVEEIKTNPKKWYPPLRILKRHPH